MTSPKSLAPFESLYQIPSRNGVSRPKKVRGQGVPMVNMGELFRYDRIGDITMELVPMSSSELERFALQKDDLLFARQSLVAEGAGKCSIVRDIPADTTFESHLIRIRLDQSIACPEYYYYYFNSPQGKSNMQTIVMQVAAAGIRGSELAKLEVPVLPIAAQKAVAIVLSAYDDLIENNFKRIEKLESMARLLYAEMFTGAVVDKWPKKTVKELVQRVSPGKLYAQKNVLIEGKVPVFDQGRSGIIGYHNDEPGVKASYENPIITFANHTCYQRLIFHPFSAIQNVLPFLPVDEHDIYWLYFTTKDLVKLNDYKGHWPELMSKSVAVPEVDLSKAFGEKVKPMLILIDKLEQKNKNLAKTRDLLLPRLMSGEIEV